eukprot:12356108-Heterocapsa_arctica.AAC.1
MPAPAQPDPSQSAELRQTGLNSPNSPARRDEDYANLAASRRSQSAPALQERESPVLDEDEPRSQPPRALEPAHPGPLAGTEAL